MTKSKPLHEQYGISEIDLNFIHKYIELNFNGKQAYLALHPKVKDTTATSEGSSILRKPNVQAAYKAELKFHIQYTGMRSQDVINELVTIGNSDMVDYIQQEENGDVALKKIDDFKVTSKAIKSITITPTSVKTDTDCDGNAIYEERQKINLQLHDKIKALNLIGDSLGVFKNYTETDTEKTEFDIVDGLYGDS